MSCEISHTTSHTIPHNIMCHVYNHLLQDVKIFIKDVDGFLKFKGCIPFCSFKINFIPFEYVIPGNTLLVFVNGKLFSHYTFIMYNKSIHVGGITSRWVGADQDSTWIPANAIQGRPYIRIHNFTSCDLYLNEFVVPSNSTVHFKGRDHLGVRLGTIFNDKNGIFPCWKMLVPCTDVYYGSITQEEQPSFGGWQMDEVFNEHVNQPQFLLQEGFLSGPAISHINYDKLPPVEGTFDKNVDDWGQKLKLV